MYDVKRVRELNDAFRTSLGCHELGTIMFTQGIAAREDSFHIMRAVQNYDEFPPDDSEHDFGSIYVGEDLIYFKIDCYDLSLTAGSPDPSDPKVTARVLVIMMAFEY